MFLSLRAPGLGTVFAVRVHGLRAGCEAAGGSRVSGAFRKGRAVTSAGHRGSRAGVGAVRWLQGEQDLGGAWI